MSEVLHSMRRPPESIQQRKESAAIAFIAAPVI